MRSATKRSNNGGARFKQDIRRTCGDIFNDGRLDERCGIEARHDERVRRCKAAKCEYQVARCEYSDEAPQPGARRHGGA